MPESCGDVAFGPISEVGSNPTGQSLMTDIVQI